MEDTKKTGRPLAYTLQDAPMDTYYNRLTAWHARKARKIGEGNLSKGVRIAIEIAVRKLEVDDD